MEETKTIKEKTIELIDALKATCQTYGMGNDGNSCEWQELKQGTTAP